jgi:hypothetical protein
MLVAGVQPKIEFANNLAFCEQTRLRPTHIGTPDLRGAQLEGGGLIASTRRRKASRAVWPWSAFSAGKISRASRCE